MSKANQHAIAARRRFIRITDFIKLSIFAGSGARVMSYTMRCLAIVNNKMDANPPFPDPPAITVERTLAIIKPDAIDQADKIIEDIKRNGFTILQVSESCENEFQFFSRTYIQQQRRLRLTPEQAADFYAEHYGKMFFPSLIAFMHR